MSSSGSSASDTDSDAGYETKEGTFCLDVPLQCGVVFAARIVYKTFGRLNVGSTNAIVFPTYYTGTHAGNESLIGVGRVLDPTRYFIVIPNMLGNGLSSSPSNSPPPHDGPRFPHTTLRDNVYCQQRLMTEVFGVREIALVIGFSMGAMQAYQWAVLFPQMVKRVLAICGTAKCTPLNYVFLEGTKAALTADADFQDGEYGLAPPLRGLGAFGRVYAGWAYSTGFWRDKLYQQLGYDSVEALLKFWEDDTKKWDANDLLAMMWTWQHGDVSDNDTFKGDLAAALRSITAKCFVMPCDKDKYFAAEDSEADAALIPGAVFRPIVSDFGHTAGAPGRIEDPTMFVERALLELLRLES